MHGITFGPIRSRRFGLSLGIDLSFDTKRCDFDCVYCELDPKETQLNGSRTLSVEMVIDAVKKAQKAHPNIDVLTVTANGEPTLYDEFEALTEALNSIKGSAKLLVLTNSASLHKSNIRRALMHYDYVKCSLDSVDEKTFRRIDRPHKSIDIQTITSSLQTFAAHFKGKLIIEVLVVKGINDTPEHIKAISSFLMPLSITRVDLGTIDRPPAYNVQGVSKETLNNLARAFDASIPVHVVAPSTQNFSAASYSAQEIIDTLAKRPLSREDVDVLFDTLTQQSLEALIKAGRVCTKTTQERTFYVLCEHLHKKRQKA